MGTMYEHTFSEASTVEDVQKEAMQQARKSKLFAGSIKKAQVFAAPSAQWTREPASGSSGGGSSSGDGKEAKGDGAQAAAGKSGQTKSAHFHLGRAAGMGKTDARWHLGGVFASGDTACVVRACF